MEFGLPRTSYLSYVQKVVPSEPVVHIDNSDVIKPNSYHFEALGIIRELVSSSLFNYTYSIAPHIPFVTLIKTFFTHCLIHKRG